MSAPPARWARLLLWVLLVGLHLGCSGTDADDHTTAGEPVSSTTADNALVEDDGDPETVEDDDATTTGPSTATTADPVTIRGQVMTAEGDPLPGATVAASPDGSETRSNPDGTFELEALAEATITVDRPGWQSTEVDVGPAEADAEVTIELQPFTVRGIRVSQTVAADPEAYQTLLDLTDASTVNALVFDTKDESGTVLYRTGVTKATDLDAVDPVYDPEALLASAHQRGLYAITRVVTFEDRIWSSRDPEAKLAGAWVDATDRSNWDYPIDLALEACQLGFDEIQFDYVRYPAGRTATAAASRIPGTAEERSAVIAGFLDEARSRLAPEGCGMSAAIFGIAVSSPTDEGIGQLVEAVAPTVDALSPMVYPSHYNAGWMGFADPNDHPGPVVGRALDDGLARIDSTTLMRPWIQAFYYNGDQIAAEIDEAEQRGAGWILWNASGTYRADWLPSA